MGRKNANTALHLCYKLISQYLGQDLLLTTPCEADRCLLAKEVDLRTQEK